MPHCPSNEIYDLHIDKKGFIWIAHNLGISRYDGISFTNFTNPAQTALSMTDIIEDNHGRIWCHNFNGQIFYIQNEKMYYLRDYNLKNEITFPRMVLYGDELVVTSKKGLFICNTNTLKCNYVYLSDPENDFFGTIGLCVVKNTLLAYRVYGRWYAYKTKEGLREFPALRLNVNHVSAGLLKLEPRPLGDTAFLMDNHEGLLYGVTIANNQLVPVFKKSVPSNINTVSILCNKVWINTSASSFSLTGNDTIKNNNITAIVQDRDGNKWYSSLTTGLQVCYKAAGWQNVSVPGLPSNDYVKCIKKDGSWLLLCSEYGKIVVAKKSVLNNSSSVYTLPLRSGNPEYIQALYRDYFFVQMSKCIYILNATSHTINQIDNITYSKGITLNGNIAYLACSSEMTVRDIRRWGLNNPAKQFSNVISDSSLMTAGYGSFYVFKKQKRCRAVMFDTTTGSLLVAFTDGLQKIKDNNITPVLYNRDTLYVSSMTKYGNKIYAATFNNGLFVIKGNTVSRIASDVEAPLDAIVKIKCCNNHIWLFRSHSIEVLDADKDVFVKDIPPFPADVADITDVEEDSTNIYLATMQGLYTIPLTEKAEVVKADHSLLYVLVNGVDTVLANNIILPNTKNNLLFRLAIPVYKNAEHLHFKYRFTNGDKDPTENGWYYTIDAQRDIQFNALKPGSYTLEINAIKDNVAVSTKPLIYSFTILPPWYNTWWFYAITACFIAALFFAFYKYRIRQVLKIERIRRKISGDLHDDIGSTLSSINVYSQLAKTGVGDNEYINTIQTNTVDIINSLDDLVWNINPRNDTIGQLLSRMELFAMPLLREKGIECIFRVKADVESTLIPPDRRAHIYLLFKEMVNNVAKHSGGSVCHIYFIKKGNALRLAVQDNGKGFNSQSINRHRNGLYNMQQRAKDIKGDIVINSTPGSGTEIKVSCRIK